MEKTSVFNDARIFSVMCIISVVSSAILSYLLKGGDIFFYYIFMPLISLVSLSMFYVNMMGCQGWRVLHFKTVFGMPVRLFVVYFLMGVPLVIFLYMGKNYYSEFPESDQRAKLFIFNVFMGLVYSLFVWFPVMKNSTAKADEYKIRVELKRKGWTQEKIEAEIKRLRNLDLI